MVSLPCGPTNYQGPHTLSHAPLFCVWGVKYISVKSGPSIEPYPPCPLETEKENPRDVVEV